MGLSHFRPNDLTCNECHFFPISIFLFILLFAVLFFKELNAAFLFIFIFNVVTLTVLSNILSVAGSFYRVCKDKTVRKPRVALHNFIEDCV